MKRSEVRRLCRVDHGQPTGAGFVAGFVHGNFYDNSMTFGQVGLVLRKCVDRASDKSGEDLCQRDTKS